MARQKSSNATLWESYAVPLDTKVRETVAQQFEKLPGVLTVLNYSNNYNKGSTPNINSDLDLVICVDDSKDISTFVSCLEYCIQRYPMFFRNRPWVIPKSLWREFIDSQPYDVQVLTDLLNKNPDRVQKFFSRYELLIEGLFAIVGRVHAKQYDNLLQKYIQRTWTNLEESTHIFYKISNKPKQFTPEKKIPTTPEEYIEHARKLKAASEQLSDDLMDQLNVSSPIEQVVTIPGYRASIFFIPSELYPAFSRHLNQIDFLSLKVMNTSLLAYAEAMANRKIYPAKTAPLLTKAFLERRMLHQKILKFIEKNNLKGKVSLPFFARLQSASKMKFR